MKEKTETKEWNGWKIKLFSLLVCFVIFGYVLPPIHEASHSQVCRWLGGDATIESTAWGWGGQMNWVQVPAHHLWLVYLAGGMGVFIIFITLWFWFRYSRTMWDLNYELSLFLWAIASLFYACTEVILVFGASYIGIFNIASEISAIAALAVVAWIYRKKIIKWLTTQEKIVHVEGKRKVFEKISSILFCVVLVGIMAGHLNAWFKNVICNALGGTCCIKSIPWLGLEGKIHFTGISGHELWAMELSGILVFLAFLCLWIWAYKSPTLWDTNMGFALAIWGAAELALGSIKLYGWFYPQWTGFENALFAVPICLSVFVGILYIPKIKKWLATKEIVQRRIIA